MDAACPVPWQRHDLGLGPYPEITLAQARDKALAPRREILAAAAPPAARQEPKGLTSKEAAETLIESKRPGWRNGKHSAQWGSTLRTYVYRTLGNLDVRNVDTRSVLDTLRPIWTTKPETASQVRQRVEAVLDYAEAIKARMGDNPARWRGHLDYLLPKPAKVRRVEHHAALNWRETAGFIMEFAKREAAAARALGLAILTAARSGEVRGMTWSEVDRGAALWTLPAGRIKAGREHRVPLTPAALGLLGEPGTAGARVFPSPGDPAKALSDMTLTAVLRRMDRADVTVRGFRSTFRDWAGETTNHAREVVEAVLAH